MSKFLTGCLTGFAILAGSLTANAIEVTAISPSPATTLATELGTPTVITITCDQAPASATVPAIGVFDEEGYSVTYNSDDWGGISTPTVTVSGNEVTVTIDSWGDVLTQAAANDQDYVQIRVGGFNFMGDTTDVENTKIEFGVLYISYYFKAQTQGGGGDTGELINIELDTPVSIAPSQKGIFHCNFTGELQVLVGSWYGNLAGKQQSFLFTNEECTQEVPVVRSQTGMTDTFVYNVTANQDYYLYYNDPTEPNPISYTFTNLGAVVVPEVTFNQSVNYTKDTEYTIKVDGDCQIAINTSILLGESQLMYGMISYKTSGVSRRISDYTVENPSTGGYSYVYTLRGSDDNTYYFKCQETGDYEFTYYVPESKEPSTATAKITSPLVDAKQIGNFVIVWDNYLTLTSGTMLGATVMGPEGECAIKNYIIGPADDNHNGDNSLSLTLSDPVTADGTFTITLPQGVVNVDGQPNKEQTLTFEHKWVPELLAMGTLKNDEFSTADNEITVEVEWNSPLTLAETFDIPVKLDNESVGSINSTQYVTVTKGDTSVLSILLSETDLYKGAGVYSFDLPQGLVEDDGFLNPAQTITVTVTAPAAPIQWTAATANTVYEIAAYVDGPTAYYTYELAEDGDLQVVQTGTYEGHLCDSEEAAVASISVGNGNLQSEYLPGDENDTYVLTYSNLTAGIYYFIAPYNAYDDITSVKFVGEETTPEYIGGAKIEAIDADGVKAATIAWYDENDKPYSIDLNEGDIEVNAVNSDVIVPEWNVTLNEDKNGLNLTFVENLPIGKYNVVIPAGFVVVNGDALNAAETLELEVATAGGDVEISSASASIKGISLNGEVKQAEIVWSDSSDEDLTIALNEACNGLLTIENADTEELVEGFTYALNDESTAVVITFAEALEAGSYAVIIPEGFVLINDEECEGTTILLEVETEGGDVPVDGYNAMINAINANGVKEANITWVNADDETATLELNEECTEKVTVTTEAEGVTVPEYTVSVEDDAITISFEETLAEGDYTVYVPEGYVLVNGEECTAEYLTLTVATEGGDVPVGGFNALINGYGTDGITAADITWVQVLEDEEVKATLELNEDCEEEVGVVAIDSDAIVPPFTVSVEDDILTISFSDCLEIAEYAVTIPAEFVLVNGEPCTETTLTLQVLVSGIDSIFGNDGDVKVYNLNGVQVNKENLSKGLYIINGKKVMIRK